MQILTNHLGYESDDYKKAVCQGEENDIVSGFAVLDETGNEVLSGKAEPVGTVANWGTGSYWVLDFSSLHTSGTYTIEVKTEKGCVSSFSFEIHQRLITMRMLNAVSYYFRAQRSSGEWLAEDRCLPFDGDRKGKMDVHGGWYDATGDYGIHMSHLSHSSFHNPQQAAFSAYVFFKTADLLMQSGNREYSMLERRILDEGTFGADFIMRMRAPSGSFLRSINRRLALDTVRGTRKIGFEYHSSSDQFSEKAETADEEIVTDENYEVSFRSGGGMCIAALAAASGHYYPGADFTGEEYVRAAKDAWAYLYDNNERYTNDGQWNLIDEYCALTAVVELYRATREYEYLSCAEEMAGRIFARMTSQGENMAWFDMCPGQPFYSAADEGLPILALLAFAEIEPDAAEKQKAMEAAEKAMRWSLRLTMEKNNPFGYPRYRLRSAEGQLETRFFFSHESTAKPWWQGDNARLASLSAAARAVADITKDENLREALLRYAQDQLNWIMGLNPFDACMIEGYGRNNIQYFFHGRYDFMNCPGGICNGITSGLHDEEGIAFVSRANEEVDDNWRWAEQWIPHASWFILANALKRR
jgi:hypothetical protein